MRSPWGFCVCASLLLVATYGVAAPEAAPGDPAAAADKIIDEIQSAARTVRQQLQAARAQRDLIKTLCLNDKLTQLDVAVRNARERREALLAAVARADAAVIGQERARLEVNREQGRKVASEAHQCVGQPDPTVTPSEVVPSEPPGLPTPVEYPVPPDVITIVQPPVPVSAYK
jgi:hypothetical protein